MSGAANGEARCGSQQVKGLETSPNASVVANRHGNERGVNVSKRCGYNKGFLPEMDACTFNDVWLCWSFQANFMYSPVLAIIKFIKWIAEEQQLICNSFFGLVAARSIVHVTSLNSE